MGKIIRLTESDLTRLVNRVITEQEQQKKQVYAKRFITETMEASQSLVDKAKGMVSGGKKPDSSMMSKIVSCIKQEGLTHLAILTTGAGAYALGLIVALIGSGIGAGLGLAMAGAVLIILEGIGVKGQGVGDEVDRLLNCYNSK